MFALLVPSEPSIIARAALYWWFIMDAHPRIVLGHSPRDHASLCVPSPTSDLIFRIPKLLFHTNLRYLTTFNYNTRIGRHV